MKQIYRKNSTESVQGLNPEPSKKKQLMLLFGKKSNLKGSLAVAKNWVAFILCFISIAWINKHPSSFVGIIGYIVTSFFAGCTLRGFDNLTHEASHNNIFTAKKFNRTLQSLYSYIVCKTVEDYAPAHYNHHRNYINNKEDDPDTQQNIRLGVGTLTHKNKSYQILWFYVIRFFLLYYFILIVS